MNKTKSRKSNKTLDDKIQTIQKVTAPKANIPVVSQPTYNRRKIAFRFILSIIFLATITLTILAYYNPYFPIDLTITKLIQEFNPLWFYTLMNLISLIGNPLPRILLVSIVVFFLFLKKRGKDGITIIGSVFGAAAIETILKVLVHRSRPNPQLIHQIRQFLSPDSFPSGHVLFFVGFFGFIFYLVYVLPPKNNIRQFFLIALGVLLLLIGPSRIYLGAHWFSDVMGAYLIGFLWLVVVVYFYNRWHPKVKEN